MCGRYELTTDFQRLPELVHKELPQGFEKNYQKQSLIKPFDPVLVVKNEGKTITACQG